MSGTSVPGRTRTRDEADPSDAVAWLDRKGQLSVVPRGQGGRRRMPQLLAGVLLVVVCVGGALWWSGQSQDRVTVLATTHSVPVGHVLQPADLRSVKVSLSAGVATVPADQAAVVLGHPMATSLTAGALVTPDSIGHPMIPPSGCAVVAVGLKPGQFPPELAAGTGVSVVVTASASSPAGQSVVPGMSWPGLVMGIAAPDSGQITVVSLQLAAEAAGQVAQVPAGQVALVMTSGGGG